MRFIVRIFTKITGALPMWLKFRPRVYYVNKKAQSRRIKGKAIIISNHKSVYDFALMLLLFPFRSLRYLMGEILLEKPILRWFLKNMGGIFVNRKLKDMSFLKSATDILKKGGVVGSFPESRLPDQENVKGELLPFTPSTASIALKSGAPVIPVYFERSKKGFHKTYVIIGEKIWLKDTCNDSDPSVEKLKELSAMLRNSIIELKNKLNIILEKNKNWKDSHA